MKTLMKSIMSFVLVLALTFTACSGAIFAAVKAISEMDTPIAKIPNDTYTPMSDKERDKQSAYALAKEIGALGGNVDVYDSEEEYEKAQARKYSASNDIALRDVSFKPVKQTITVMTTPTGSTEHGNYVASVPIPNAIVRINGVPRYTDRKGQIRVTLDREYVELFVEKNEYNPYIEFMDVTGDDKVIHMKKQSDDIDVYAAMLNFADESYNLLAQPYNIAVDYMDYYAELILMANVNIDSAYLYVNGELDTVAPNHRFMFFDYNSYKVGDKFSIKIKYNGVWSKSYDLNLNIVDPQKILNDTLDSSLNEMIAEYSETSSNINNNAVLGPDINIDEKNDLGAVGEFKIDFAEVIQYILKLKKDASDNLISPNSLKKNILNGLDYLKFSMVYLPRTGVIRITLGITIKSVRKKHELQGYKETLDKMKEAKKKLVDDETKLRNLQAAYNENKKNEGAVEDAVNKKIENELKEYQKYYNKKSEVYKQAEQNLQNQNRGIINEAKNKTKLVEDALDKSKNAVNGFKDVIKADKKGFTQFNRMVTLEFEFYGVFEIDSRGQFVNCNVVAGFEVRVSFTKQVLVWSIPMYFKATVDGRLEVKLNVIKNGGLEIQDWKSFWMALEFILKVHLQGDVGVGLYDVISVGGFLRFQVYYDFPLASIDPKSDKKAEGEFNIQVGVRAKALIFEYTHTWDLYSTKFGLNKSSQPMSVADRNCSELNANKMISLNQIFSSPFQDSKQQLIDLGNNKSILIWVADDIGRDTYNRTVLTYAVCDNGVWSESKTVTNDTGLADFYPDIYKDGDDLHITWQRSNKFFTETDDLVSMSKSNEIYYARFDNNKNEFVDVAQITSDNDMDLAPKFALKEKASDPLTIIWQKNSYNDIMGRSGVNEIQSSIKLGNGWSEPRTEYSSENIIAHATGAVKDGKLNIVCVEDVDKDALTDKDRIVTAVADRISTTLDTGSLGNTQFAIVNGKATLFYYSDTKIVSTEDFKNYHVVLTGDKAEFSLGFDVISDANGLGILYRGSDGKVSQGFAAVYNGVTKTWSKNIKLTDEEVNVSAISGYFDEFGKFTYSYIVMNDDFLTAICYNNIEFNYGIEVSEIFNLQNLNNGSEVTFGLRLYNSGSYSVDKFVVDIFGNSVEIAPENELQSNDSALYFVSILPKFESELFEIIKVYAFSNGIQVAEAEYNFRYEYCDLQLQIDVSIKNGKQVFNIDVTNNSKIVSGYRIEVYQNHKKVNEFTGEILGYSTNEKEFSFDNVSFNDYIFIKIIADEEEIDINNNYVSYYSDRTEITTIARENQYRASLDFAKGVCI